MMPGLVLILVISAAFVCGAYFLVMFLFVVGWIKNEVPRSLNQPSTPVAIIIAVRNEAASISRCIEGLLQQDYPAGLIEIIIVDDHSEDDTFGILKGYASRTPRIKTYRSAGEGKRAALDAAVAATDAPFILATDGDCIHPKGWVTAMASFYESTGCRMIAGPVMFTKEKTAWSCMQTLEMLAVMGTTGGSLYWGMPVMCNGANLAFSREAFIAAGGYSIEKGISGDDIHLMYRIAGKEPGRVQFLRDRNAIVNTAAMPDFTTFMAQRRRWASKPLRSLSGPTVFVAALVWLTSLLLLLSLVVSAIAGQAGLPIFRFCLILVTIKCIIEFLLLFLAATFFDRKNCLYLFLPEQLLYMVYAVIIGLPWKRKTYEWKGRRIHY